MQFPDNDVVTLAALAAYCYLYGVKEHYIMV